MSARKISYNILFVGTTKVLSIFLALYAIRELSQHFSTDGFGRYVTALAYLGLLMALADMGLYATTTRAISRKGADENAIINKAFTLRVVTTGFLFLLALLVIWFLPYDEETRRAIWVIAGAFLFSSTYSILNGVFQKHIAMDRVGIAEFLGKLVQVTIIIILVREDLPFIFAALAVLGAMVTNFLLVLLLVRKYITLKWDFDPQFWKEMLSKSWPLGVSAIAVFLYFKVDTILLSLFQSQSDVGIYGAAYKIIETLIFFPAMVIGLVFPLLSRDIFTDPEAFQRTIKTTIKFFIIILAPLTVSLFFLAPTAINIINGPDFIESVVVLKIITFTLIGIFFGNLFSNVAIAANLQKILMWIFLAAAAFNIGLNLILIPQYSYMGAALSSVATELLVMVATLVLILKKTSFKFSLDKTSHCIFAVVIIIAANSLLPGAFPGLHPMIIAFVGVIFYAIYLLLARVVTKQDLQNIRPSTKGV